VPRGDREAFFRSWGDSGWRVKDFRIPLFRLCFLVSGGKTGWDEDDWIIEFRKGNDVRGSVGYRVVTWNILRDEFESLERVGILLGGRGKFGREDWCFKEDVERSAIGIVDNWDVGDVGGDVQDCVGRWDSREGVSEEIEEWWWIVARLIGITESQGLSADDNAEERTCVDGSNLGREVCTERIMINAIFCQYCHFKTKPELKEPIPNKQILQR
jgi:hypothetical protein